MSDPSLNPPPSLLEGLSNAGCGGIVMLVERVRIWVGVGREKQNGDSKRGLDSFNSMIEPVERIDREGD